MIYRVGRMLCLIAWTLILPCSCIGEEEPTEEVVTVGDRLPNFEVTMNDGTTITGAMLRGTPSVVMFFHTSCPDCQQTLPRVQRLYDTYACSGVKFALISREDGEASVASYWEKHGLTMPYSAQEDRGIYELFAYQRVPRVYVSDATGTIRHIFTDNPTPTDEMLDEAVKGLGVQGFGAFDCGRGTAVRCQP